MYQPFSVRRSIPLLTDLHTKIENKQMSFVDQMKCRLFGSIGIKNSKRTHFSSPFQRWKFASVSLRDRLFCHFLCCDHLKLVWRAQPTTSLFKNSAFDKVSLASLLEKISLNINGTVKRWLSSYFRGLQTFVEFHNEKSKHRKMTQEVLQESVLSPTLFNLYSCSMP